MNLHVSLTFQRYLIQHVSPPRHLDPTHIIDIIVSIFFHLLALHWQNKPFDEPPNTPCPVSESQIMGIGMKPFTLPMYPCLSASWKTATTKNQLTSLIRVAKC